MVILDTDHISVLERRGPTAESLIKRLESLPVHGVRVTVISYEEQFRGWTAAIARADDDKQVLQYGRLLAQLENYCNLYVLPTSAEAAAIFTSLRKRHRRLSASDLKIASIALENRATLLTRNQRDFDRIEGLATEDWTA